MCCKLFLCEVSSRFRNWLDLLVAVIRHNVLKDGLPQCSSRRHRSVDRSVYLHCKLQTYTLLKSPPPSLSLSLYVFMKLHRSLLHCTRSKQTSLHENQLLTVCSAFGLTEDDDHRPMHRSSSGVDTYSQPTRSRQFVGILDRFAPLAFVTNRQCSCRASADRFPVVHV